jgi:transcriptional regulator with XRE-family HTH domain
MRRLGRRLSDYRRARGLTQEKLAELVSVDRSYISMVENGQRNPSIGMLRRTAIVLRVSLGELFKPF